MTDHREFTGKVALVTGAGRGIGQAVARKLTDAGATVAEFDLAFDRLNEQRFVVDVSDSRAVNQAVAEVEARLGPIDLLASVAGILRLGTLLECSDEDWERSFAVNATGAFNVCRAVGRRMVPRQGGAMVVVGSNAAQTPRMKMGAYAASKAAATQMLKCLGLELAAERIRCNLVAPGSTDTAMQRQCWADEQGAARTIEGSLATHRLGIPLKRIASPEEVAKVVRFLLSSQAAHITLETITVDGGATLGL